MSVKVRFGSKNDIPALVDVECSDVDSWHHFSREGRGSPASYSELSLWERVMHGGPWMDADALARYWRRIERLRVIVLVAELNGTVAGHLDIVFSEEPSLGTFLYLDVLKVHKAYRRRGVARALINEAEKLAKLRKVKSILVRPEEYDGPSGLMYRSCGFERGYEVYEVELKAEGSRMPKDLYLTTIPQTQEAPLKTHDMICRGYNISLKTWDDGVNPTLEFNDPSHHHLALSALTNGGIYFIHLTQRLFDWLRASLCLWAPIAMKEESLLHVCEAAKALASLIGAESLTTLCFEKDVEMLKRIGFLVKGKKKPYMIKRMKAS